MKRRILNILAAVSLVLALAVAGLWIRSYFVNDYVHWHHYKNGSVDSLKGTLSVSSYVYGGVYRPPPVDIPIPMPTWTYGVAQRPAKNFGGRRPRWYIIGWEEGPTFNGYFGWTLTVPYWLLFGLVSIAPIWRFRKRATGAPAEAICPTCTYHLRASKGECPKCGAKIAAT
jgi:hypothetical protein